MTTKIEWTHYTAPDGKIVKGFTLNPAKGCSHAAYQPATGGHKIAHPGCQNCYAEGFCKRNLHGEAATVGKWDGTIETYPDRLAWPFTKFKARRDGLPRIGFTHSESDPGHPNYPEEFWMAVQGAMILSPWIIWKDLTKRPEKLNDLLYHFSPRDCVEALTSYYDDVKGLFDLEITPDFDGAYLHSPTCPSYCGFSCGLSVNVPEKWSYVYHIHRYISISDQPSTDALIPEILRMPAAVRGVSLEPMTGAVEFGPYLPSLDHVIIGGESGRNARPFDLQWAEDVIQQCRRAGVPCYVKQIGSNPIEGPMILPRTQSSKGGDPTEWPEALRVRQHVGLPEGCF